MSEKLAKNLFIQTAEEMQAKMPKASPLVIASAIAVKAIQEIQELVQKDNEQLQDLENAIREIAEFAHARSTGPAVPDDLWRIRGLAYDAMDMVSNVTVSADPAPAAAQAGLSEDAKRLEHIVAIGWEGLRRAWERFGEDHQCETALEEIRAVIDADLSRAPATPQSEQTAPHVGTLEIGSDGEYSFRPNHEEIRRVKPAFGQRSTLHRVCLATQSAQPAEPKPKGCDCDFQGAHSFDCPAAEQPAEPSGDKRKHFDEVTERLLKGQNSFSAKVANIGQQIVPESDEVLRLHIEMAGLRQQLDRANNRADNAVALSNHLQDKLTAQSGQRAGVGGLPQYTWEMGEAANRYHAQFKMAHPLPAQWRWHELWGTMLAAAPAPAAQTQAEKKE